MIGGLAQRAAPQLLEPFGVGVDTAAEILVVTGDNPERIKSEAALAKLAGIAPVPTGSGMTSGRHRINHGGHRQLNAAITEPSSSECGSTSPRSTTSPAAPPRARRNARSSDVSSVTSSARSTTCSDPHHERPPQRVDNYRSVNATAEALDGTFKARIAMQGPRKDVD